MTTTHPAPTAPAATRCSIADTPAWCSADHDGDTPTSYAHTSLDSTPIEITNLWTGKPGVIHVDLEQHHADRSRPPPGGPATPTKPSGRSRPASPDEPLAGRTSCRTGPPAPHRKDPHMIRRIIADIGITTPLCALLFILTGLVFAIALVLNVSVLYGAALVTGILAGTTWDREIRCHTCGEPQEEPPTT